MGGLFAFGATRVSNFEMDCVPPPPNMLPAPGKCEPLFQDAAFVPVCAQNFEQRLALGGRPASGSDSVDHHIWVRHVGAGSAGGVEGVEDSVALLALADMAPPAIVARYDVWSPVSTVTWQVNLLREPSPSYA